jgi:FkbM family methyltransferase
MTTTTTCTIPGGVQVIVPDGLDHITTYVLEEQQDWFEDEIKAVRTLLQPGDWVIDIGANLGVYALSMARVVGPEGRVIAFEPATSTAALLRESARLNGFSQLTVDQRGVAANSGEARLAIGDNAELNQLTSLDADGDGETVPLTSLDDWLATRASQEPIAFMKIDAEGQELNILRGGQRFLQQHDPLILFEIKHGSTIHLELVEAFASHGYRSYRLLPGPQLLEPFDPQGEMDGFLLNLFCCKATTARRLSQQGRLLDSPPAREPGGQAGCGRAQPTEQHTWPRALGAMPYAIQLRERWPRQEDEDPDAAAPTLEALALYALSADPDQPAAARAEALHRSVALLRDACGSWGSPLHLASLARAAADAGKRVLAVEALESLIAALAWFQDEDFQEPFLAPLPRFDNVAPQDSLRDWLLVAAIEAHEQLRHYSSFFTGPLLRERLEAALSLGYRSETLERRLSLINRRFPRS